MRGNIAQALGIDISQVNVKATTEEGLGFTGSGEGISSQAVACFETVANCSYVAAADYGGDFAGCQGCCGRAKEE